MGTNLKCLRPHVGILVILFFTGMTLLILQGCLLLVSDEATITVSLHVDGNGDGSVRISHDDGSEQEVCRVDQGELLQECVLEYEIEVDDLPDDVTFTLTLDDNSVLDGWSGCDEDVYVPGNCSLKVRKDRPRRSAGVVLRALPGSIPVNNSTEGQDIPFTPYTVTVDAGSDSERVEELPVNGTVTFTSVGRGQHEVTLGDVPLNCSALWETQSVNVPPGGSSSPVLFPVRCEVLPTTARIEVSSSTTGTDLDPDGYEVVLDEGQDQKHLDINDDRVVFLGLVPGNHQVKLDHMATNCTVDGGDLRTEDLEAGDTLTIHFEVSCEAHFGELKVTATTTGVDPDPDGFEVVLDQGAAQEHLDPNNDEVTFAGLSPGTHEVKLNDVAPNCTVTDGDSRNADVVAGESATVSFAVVCVGNAGDLSVSATTTGVNLDPDGYEVVLDDGQAQQHLDINGGTVTFSDVTAGSHRVQLAHVATNCVVDGDNPRNVPVEIGETASTAFQVTCSAPLEPLIAFQSNRDGDTEIYTMKEDGSEVTKLTDNTALDEDPAWSPDGTKIAFQSSRDGTTDIWVMDHDGDNAVQLTNTSAVDVAPDWSPDGTKIVFRSNRDGNREIYVMNVDGSGVTRLTDHGAKDDKPHFSPDGKRILFKSNRNGGDYDLFTMALDGSEVQPITNNSASDHDPSWSPDGTQIAFGSDRSGDDEIWFMDASALFPAQKVTRSSKYDHQPDWSPDGLRLVFTREWDIWVIDLAGTNAVNLTNHGATDANPAWRR